MAALTHDVLNNLLKLKQEEAMAQGKGELTRVNKLAQEFLKMKVPHGSEILDVAAGSGIQSNILQLHGYYNIDALDEDLDVLHELRNLKLYRNYIHRGVKGLRSTGLEADVYDVVITAGGFAKDAINPLDVTELLRILRPEGHLLWTMKPAEEERSSEFGLLHANLRSLERAGRVIILKHETFHEETEEAAGEFYLIKRLAGELPYYAKDDISDELKDQITHILQDSTDPQNRIEFYDAWSSKYENDLIIAGGYTGHIKCAEAFFQLGLRRDVWILDMACGTGLLGLEVVKHGYVNIDGLDSSLGMISAAKLKNIYKEYILAQVKGAGSLPLLDESYDVVVCSNGFAPGQIYPEAIEEILRILRPGGYLLFTMRDGFEHTSPRFAVLDPTIKDLERKHLAEMVMGPVTFDDFVLEQPGVFYMLRKVAERHMAYADTQL